MQFAQRDTTELILGVPRRLGLSLRVTSIGPKSATERVIKREASSPLDARLLNTHAVAFWRPFS